MEQHIRSPSDRQPIPIYNNRRRIQAVKGNP